MSVLFPVAPVLYTDNVIKVTLYFLNEASQTKVPWSRCRLQPILDVSCRTGACKYKIHMSSASLMASVLEAIKHDRVGW